MKPRRLRLRTVVRARSPYGSSARAAGGRRRRGLSRFPDAFVVGNLTVRGAPGPDHRVARAPGWLFPRHGLPVRRPRDLFVQADVSEARPGPAGPGQTNYANSRYPYF